MNGFDSHVAVEVSTMNDINEIRDKLSLIGWNSFEINHDFVVSLYIFDPNGIQLEFTCRTNDHDKIMKEDAEVAHEELKKWTERTRDMKLNSFGKKDLDKRKKN